MTSADAVDDPGTGRQPDVLVVGGGPVGLAAAIDARLRGHSVLLVEPRLPTEDDPGGGGAAGIEKACGEGLMPVALTELARLGVDPVGGSFQGIRYRDGVTGRGVRAPLPSPGRGVERAVLSATLLARARQVGVRLWRARCVGVTPGELGGPDSLGWARVDVVDPRIDPGTPVTAEPGVGAAPVSVFARWVLSADGLHSPVRRMLGVQTRQAPARRWGLHEHLTLPPWSEDVEVFWGATTETYVTPLGTNRIGLAVLGPQGLSLQRALDESPALARHVGVVHREQRPRVRGAGTLWQRPRQQRNGNVLFIGDAAGYVDGLTGDGLGVGFLTGRAALDAIETDGGWSYEQRWRRASRRYRLLTAGVVLAATSPARPLLVPAARALPKVFETAVTLLSGADTSPPGPQPAPQTANLPAPQSPCITREDPVRPLRTST